MKSLKYFLESHQETLTKNSLDKVFSGFLGDILGATFEVSGKQKETYYISGVNLANKNIRVEDKWFDATLLKDRLEKYLDNECSVNITYRDKE